MIKINDIELPIIKFPSGEVHIRAEEFFKENKIDVYNIQVSVKFKSNDDIIALMLVDNILYNKGYVYTLDIKYFPSSRQDRVQQEYESDSLTVYANIINNLKSIISICILDPHSEVTVKALKLPTYVENLAFTTVFSKFLINQSTPKHIVIVSPDKGARGRALDVAEELKYFYTNVDVLTADKVRDYNTGNIVSIQLLDPESITVLPETVFLVVDDICDGGRTFIELIYKLQEAYQNNPRKPIHVDLMVSHGFFSKGLDVLHKMGYSKVYYANDMRRI
jgi:ribose-phosphate pyrophosphokinase